MEKGVSEAASELCGSVMGGGRDDTYGVAEMLRKKAETTLRHPASGKYY